MPGPVLDVQAQEAVRLRKQRHRASSLRSLDKFRAEVRQFIGWDCHECGAPNLGSEVDHVEGRTWDIRKCNIVQRWRIYAAEAREGMLKAICPWCHRAQGGHMRWKKAREQPQEEVPF